MPTASIASTFTFLLSTRYRIASACPFAAAECGGCLCVIFRHIGPARLPPHKNGLSARQITCLRRLWRDDLDEVLILIDARQSTVFEWPAVARMHARLDADAGILAGCVAPKDRDRFACPDSRRL
jgi:hypothetical protein